VAVVDPATGHVLAATGNRAYEELQFDLATQARRQPGSTFKAFVLAAAIADGHHPDEPLDGRQGEVALRGGGSWEVRNYDRRDHPEVSLAGATRASVNSAFARLGDEVGVARVAGLATAMGVRSPVPEDVQITIGGGELAVTPLDLAAGFGTLANLGVHVPTTPVARVLGPDGEVVWLPDTVGRQVLEPSAAHVTTEVLREVVEHGTALAARVPGWEVAGKTGTTSDHADAWFVGFTPTLSAAVWMGHVEGRVPLLDVQGVRRVTGGTLPARLFADLVTAALRDEAPVPFRLPDEGYVLVDVDPTTGMLAAAWCPGETQRLPRVLAPRETCPPPPPSPPARPSPPPSPPPPSPSPPAVATFPDDPAQAPTDRLEPAPEPTAPAAPLPAPGADTDGEPAGREDGEGPADGADTTEPGRPDPRGDG
jgi:penicillin-binding protein 1A